MTDAYADAAETCLAALEALPASVRDRLAATMAKGKSTTLAAIGTAYLDDTGKLRQRLPITLVAEALIGDIRGTVAKLSATVEPWRSIRPALAAVVEQWHAENPGQRGREGRRRPKRT